MSSKNTVEIILKLRDELGNVAKKAQKQIQNLVGTQDQAAKSGKKLAKANSGISKSVEGMKGSMKGLVVSIAASVAAFASMSVISQRSKDISQLVRDADRLKVSINELSAAQYAAFADANLGSEALVDGIQDLNEKISDFAAAGAGEAVDLFTTLGLDADIYNKKNSLEQLLSVAESFKDLDNGDQLRFLDQLGSDNLRALAPILRDGGKHYKELTLYAKETGIAINDVDAKSIRRMNDELRKTGSLSSALTTKVLANLSPAINKVTKSFNSMFESQARASKGAADEVGTLSKVYAGYLATISFLLANSRRTIMKFDLYSKQNFIILHDFFSAVAVEITKIYNKLSVATLSTMQYSLSKLGTFIDKAKYRAEELQTVIDNLKKPIKGSGDSEYIKSIRLNVAGLEDDMKATDVSFSELYKSYVKGFEADLKINSEVDVESDEDKAIKRALETQELRDEQKKVLEIKAENAAKAANYEIELQKSSLKQIFDLKNSELDSQASKEIKTAAEVALEKINIEKKYNSDLSKLEQSETNIEIDKLKENKSNLISKSAKANSINKKAIEGEVAKIDGEIAELQREQSEIIRQTEYANQLLDSQVSARTHAVTAETTAAQLEALEAKLTEVRDNFSNGLLTFDQAENESIPIIDQLNEVLNKSSDNKKIKELSSLIQKVKSEFSELKNIGSIVGESIGNNFINGFDEMIAGTKSVKDAFKDMARDILSQLAKVYAKQLLISALGGPNGASSENGLVGGLASGLLSSVGVFHGGTSNVGSDVSYSRFVDPNIFANAVKYHVGGIAGKQPGFASNELPAILEKNEMVLTEGQQKALGSELSNKGSTAVNIQNNIVANDILDNVDDDLMEDKIMNVVRGNKSEISSY